MSEVLSLFGRLPELEPVVGRCVACCRRPASMGWVTVDPVAIGGACSRVGLCDPCAKLVGAFERARDGAHEAARYKAARVVAGGAG